MAHLTPAIDLDAPRRAQLHREIGALKAHLKQVLQKNGGCFNTRAGRLNGKVRRLERELIQPSLL